MIQQSQIKIGPSQFVTILISFSIGFFCYMMVLIAINLFQKYEGYQSIFLFAFSELLFGGSALFLLRCFKNHLRSGIEISNGKVIYREGGFLSKEFNFPLVDIIETNTWVNPTSLLKGGTLLNKYLIVKLENNSLIFIHLSALTSIKPFLKAVSDHSQVTPFDYSKLNS